MEPHISRVRWMLAASLPLTREAVRLRAIFVGPHALVCMGRRQPFESDFEISASWDAVAAYFRPSGSLYTFRRFLARREIDEFGLLSPDAVVRHGSPRNGTNKYDAAAVLSMAFRLATAVVGRSPYSAPLPTEVD
jgi:hypothetical protein